MQKQEITNLFSNFNSLNVLIIGDVMLDSYIWGNADRISPEAPVPVVLVEKRQERLGGAANVALNVKSLGANPIVCSIIGSDSKGESLLKLFKENNLSTKGLIKTDKRITTTKFRVIANNHQLIRVDEETDKEISSNEENILFEKISSTIKENKIGVIIFQDYDKGVITKKLIEEVVELAVKSNIPTVVDPKKRNFNNYKNVTLFKPNLKELKEGLKLDISQNNTDNIYKAIDILENNLKNEITLLTLSDKGVLISNKGKKQIIPAHLRDISDVSGAGDTVVCVAALCIALKTDLTLLASLANLAGGIVCEHAGIVAIDKKQLLEEAVNTL
ncbi:MAG: bifunctional ADP-heptose synthase [Bacteroidales bacterium]|nr:bifunctional ADP-heptose synthase [Bacteroidales bacterium]